MIGSVGFQTLVACRIALGAGEGPATPVALHSAYKWFPNERRTLPTAVIVEGRAIGVMVALPLLNWVIVRWTWHWAFGSLGGSSVVLGGAALAMLPYVPGTPVKIALTTLGVALPSAIYVISNAVVGEITPAAQRGALLAIGTAVASSAGLLAPYIMGSVIESATTPLDGFNTGFFMCGVIMLVGGAIAMALLNPEREAKRRSRRLQPLTAST
jgi:MFS family permease